MRVPLAEVPIELRRKAVNHLESLRGTPMAPPGTAGAEIVGEACPIYRPDLGDVAYWEFEVAVAGEAGSGMLATRAALGHPEMLKSIREEVQNKSEGELRAEERGFIIVSTGEHDFPVPHWSLQRPPVSRQLEMDADEAGATIARIYKLDALAYIGENEAGEEVARSGQTPALLEGLGHDLGRRAGEISSLTAKPSRGGDDAKPRGIKHSVARTGAKAPEVRASEPEEWPALKKRYADSFGPLLDALRRKAEQPWHVDKLVAEFGEGVVAGEPLAIGLLQREAVVEVTGEGAAFVDVELDEKRGRKPRVRVRAHRSPHSRETEFEVRIKYGNGEEESLRYFIVSRDTPSNVRAEQPQRGEAE